MVYLKERHIRTKSVSKSVQERSWDDLGASWGDLGPSWVDLGASLQDLGVILGAQEGLRPFGGRRWSREAWPLLETFYESFFLQGT